MQKNHFPDEAGLYSNGEKFSDIVTKRKIDKHLSDINDVISEDDIKNVKTDVTVGEDTDNEEAFDDVPVKDDTSMSKKDDEKDDEKKDESFPIVTPWNVLGS